jgi:hypothetical protein
LIKINFKIISYFGTTDLSNSLKAILEKDLLVKGFVVPIKSNVEEGHPLIA